MSFVRELDLFVAVARSLSFRSAAKSLGLAVSTLSRRIAEFERELGLQLFVRTTRRVELTPAARRYLARCEAILEAAREAREDLLGQAASPSGRLRVSMEADVGATLIAPAIAAMQAQYPNIGLELDLSPRRVDLIGEGFDVAIRLGTLPDSSLIARKVATLSVGLYAAKSYLKRRGEPKTPSDLVDHSRLHLLHQHDDGTWVLRSGRRHARVSSRKCLVLANNMTMLRALLRLGSGIAVMDHLMAADDVRDGIIKRVLPAWELPTIAVSVVTPSRLLPIATRLFIDQVALTLGS